MKKRALALTLQLLTLNVSAENVFPFHLSENTDKEEKRIWLTNSIHLSDQGFDSWTVTTGYHLSLMKNINIYLATGLTNESVFSSTSRGLLSGIEYNLNERVSFDGTVQAARINEETVNSMIMSSKVKITDEINMKASVDLNLNQTFNNDTNYQLGIGFQF